MLLRVILIYTDASRAGKCLEGDHVAQAEDCFVTDTTGWIIWIEDAAARVEHVLEVRLQLPPAGKLDLVGELDKGFAAAHRRRHTAEDRSVAVDSTCASAHLCHAEPEAERVVIATGQRRLQGDA